MATITNAQFTAGRFISDTPDEGVLAAEKADGSIQNLVAADESTGDVTLPIFAPGGAHVFGGNVEAAGEVLAQGTLNVRQWANLLGVPGTFAPAAHTHPFSAITGAPTTMSGYGIADAWTRTQLATAGGGAPVHAENITAGLLADARLSANVPLKNAANTFTNQVTVTRSGSPSVVMNTFATGNAVSTWVLRADGQQEWGDGTNARNVNLYWGGADILKTDDTFACLALQLGTYIELTTQGQPAAPSSTRARLWWDNTAGQLKVVNSAGTVSALGASGGAGISDGYSSLAADSGTAAASGSSSLTIIGAGGISTSVTNASPDTLTVTLGNHSAALLTSGTVAAARGGTGVNGSAAALGALLIGNGTGYTLATLTAGANVSITNSAGGITIAAASALVASLSYAPSTDNTTFSTESTSYVDVDATHLSINFIAPASGTVIVALNASVRGDNNYVCWGLRNGSNLVAGSGGLVLKSPLPNDIKCITRRIRVSGLNAGTSYTYKWAWRVDSGTGYVHTGPGDATSQFGSATMEVWSA